MFSFSYARSGWLRAVLVFSLSAVFSLSSFAGGQHGSVTVQEDEHNHDHDHDHSHSNDHEAGGHDHEKDNHNHEDSSHEEAVQVSERQLALNKIKTVTAQARTLEQTRELFGLIHPVQDKVFRVFANYESLVTQVHVVEGQRVKQGQPMVSLKNKQNLQTYTLTSPANGIVTQRFINQGDHADENPLIEISDYDTVWVELTAFLNDLAELQVGQTVRVSTLTNGSTADDSTEQAVGKITYIAPSMSGSHTGKVRVTLKNKNGAWRPGMHVKAQVKVARVTSPIVVAKSAIQLLEDETVIFIKQGEKFIPTPIVLGRADNTHVEVVSGVTKGTEYVSENSFILKADLLKAGAEHVH